MKDELGNRMKSYYENRTRVYLPRRTYTIIRVDGKCFSSFTKNLERPFDVGLIEDMNSTAEYLCKNIQGAKIGFVQSDEISVLLTDFDTLTTDAWFDGNIQKIVSVAASMATAKFNQLRILRKLTQPNLSGNLPFAVATIEAMKLAEFDARTYTIPAKTEVMNYFIWRQQDTVRNSIQSVAQNLYKNHKQLEGKNMSQQQEMIFQKGVNWNDFPAMQKRGRFVFKQEVDMNTPFESIDKCQSSYKRNRWVTDECPTFTAQPEFLDGFIPDMD